MTNHHEHLPSQKTKGAADLSQNNSLFHLFFQLDVRTDCAGRHVLQIAAEEMQYTDG